MEVGTVHAHSHDAHMYVHTHFQMTSDFSVDSENGKRHIEIGCNTSSIIGLLFLYNQYVCIYTVSCTIILLLLNSNTYVRMYRPIFIALYTEE